MLDREDLSFLVTSNRVGSAHPISLVLDEIINLLGSIGFNFIDGPEIESERYNFDMLNIHKNHPARQMHDTFYVNHKSGVLRTHTSPVQIRAMLKINLLLLTFPAVKFIGKMMIQLTYQCSIK